MLVVQAMPATDDPGRRRSLPAGARNLIVPGP